MSLVSVGSNGRTYRRSFDHDEARVRYANGERIAELARAYVVGYRAMWNAVHNWRSTASQKRDTCVDCGEACANPRKNLRSRCRPCHAKVMATSVRAESLRCVTCQEWLPDADFPHSAAERHRRGRHAQCSVCATAARTAYRNRNRVPCEDCGTPVEGKGRANSRTMKDGIRKPLDPNRPYLCRPCGLKRFLAEKKLARA